MNRLIAKRFAWIFAAAALWTETENAVAQKIPMTVGIDRFGREMPDANGYRAGDPRVILQGRYRCQAHGCRSWGPIHGGQFARPVQPNRHSTSAHPAVPRIKAPQGGMTSWGSGVLVEVRGPNAVLLTNYHVVAGTQTPYAQFGDQLYTAQVEASDPTGDLAVLLVRAPPGVKPLPIARSWQVGETVTLHGHDSGNYRAASGRITHRESRFATVDTDGFRVSLASREGDSGGPVVNRRGEVCGLLWGSDFRSGTSATGAARIKRLLQRCYPPTPHRRQPTDPQPKPPTANDALADLRADIDRLRNDIQSSVCPCDKPPQIKRPTRPPPPAQVTIDYAQLVGSLSNEQLKSIATTIAAQMPKPKDGRDGRDGKDGKDAVPQAVDRSNREEGNAPAAGAAVYYDIVPRRHKRTLTTEN